jgi:F0F1-type ATP synthase epsilon subunit
MDESLVAKKTDDEKQEKIPDGQMRIKIYSPFRDYFYDFAYSISAINDTGPFDILPGHRNFLTLLNPCELMIRMTDDTEEKIKIERGIMYVKKDRVTVFLDV